MTRLRDMLSWQLLKAVLSIYFAITLAVTLTQMGVEYLHTRNMIRSELASVERSFYPALATALWELNDEQLEAIHQGILDLPIISAIRVVDARGKEQIRTRTEHQQGSLSHTFRVGYRFDGEDIHLAEVSFEATEDVVLGRVKVGFQMILFSALIKSAALTLLFIWAFRRRLGIPLRRLTESVADIDLDSLGRKRIDLGQTRENELSIFERAFNHMLSTLDTERLAHDARLEELNRGLEAEVENRTRELEAANRDLERLARTDLLTGLANRRNFVERAEQEIQRARRSGTSLALLMIDLDHFKQINDTFGHPAGDEVLRNFALVAGIPLRAADLLARVGGEEFGVLLPETGLEGAREVAQRIMEGVRQQRIDINGNQLRYRASIGVALLMGEGDSFEALFNRADKALYRAKQAGRDRFEAAPEIE